MGLCVNIDNICFHTARNAIIESNLFAVSDQSHLNT